MIFWKIAKNQAWISIWNKEIRLFFADFQPLMLFFCSSNKRKTYLRVIGFPRDAFAQLSKFNLFHRVYSSNTKTAFPFLLFFQVFVMKVGQDWKEIKEHANPEGSFFPLSRNNAQSIMIGQRGRPSQKYYMNQMLIKVLFLLFAFSSELSWNEWHICSSYS